MIGSISKIRPCGHSCHYKYASCPNADGMKYISREWKSDVDGEGVWNKSLDTITNCYSLLKNCSDIKKVDLKLPKATSLWDFLHTSSNVTSIKIDAPNVTSIEYAFHNTKQLEEIEVYCPKVVAIGGAFSICYCKTEPKLGLKTASSANGAFDSGGTRMTKFGSNLENIQNGKNLFYYQDQITELKYPIDENGECIYDSRLPQQIINGVPQYKYLTLPKLTDGTGAFYLTKLDKPTSLSILNSLPTHTDGNTHNFSIGIHIDNKYDPDVNIALKKCQNSYTTPIEEYGATLSENVTVDKGWTLAVQWTGSKTSNAYPEPNV